MTFIQYRRATGLSFIMVAVLPSEGMTREQVDAVADAKLRDFVKDPSDWRRDT